VRNGQRRVGVDHQQLLGCGVVVSDPSGCSPAARRNTFTAANANSPWLFPGASPGQPLHQSYLMTLVRDAGVDLRGARNSALRQLVLDMPPAVAAAVLGYSATVTSQHARNAGQDFSSYPTVRSRLPPGGA